MTARLDPNRLSPNSSPARPDAGDRRLILASGVKLAMAFSMFVAVAVPDKEIAAKAFKLNLMVKNMRQRIGH